MAAPARIKLPMAYIGLWAILLSLAMTYVTALTVRPDVVARVMPPVRIGAILLQESDRDIRRAALETEALRKQLFAARAELNGVRGELARRSDRETTLALKLAAIEAAEARRAEAEAAAAAPATPAGNATALAAAKALEKARAQKSTSMQAVERLANAGTVPVETASLPASPVAKADGQQVGLQLGTGPSVDALRLNWQLLSQRYQPQLQRLQARYSTNREAAAPGQPAYDLIAGPLPNAAEAQRVCAELRAQKVGCKVSGFGGSAL